MANPTIADCPCPICKRPVEVREYVARSGKKRGFYLYCAPTLEAEGCGMIQPNLGGGQRYIRDNMTLRAVAPMVGSASVVKPVEVPPVAPSKVASAVAELIKAPAADKKPAPVEPAAPAYKKESAEPGEDLGFWGAD